MLIEKLMLMMTARLDANTPAAPFTAQNQGVGRVSMPLMICIPVGNPKPISTPEGTMAERDTNARTGKDDDAKRSTTNGNQ